MKTGTRKQTGRCWKAFVLLLGIASSAIAAPPPAPPPPQAPPPAPIPAGPALSARAALGRNLFFDASLSASGRQSCATCHTPGNAFSANDGRATPLGGPALDLQGPRNTPTLMYASFTPPFTLNTGRPTPAGGFLHDGRAASLAAQAQLPFLVPFEMANKSSAEVLQRLRQRPYLPQFTAVFGAAVLNNADNTLAAMGQAIAAWEIEDPVFHPFNSKYDAFTRGQTALTAQEQSGLRLFNDRNKGNCASCHSSAPAGGLQALFTNFSFHNLGVPRNNRIVYNLDGTALPSYITPNGFNLGAPNHAYYDMGLCGPFRTDLTRNTGLCGLFKVPTLRNVGLKQTYFHNGVMNNLNDVVSFYATRDRTPARWYTKSDGSTDIAYNDLPTAYRGNVIQQGAPFQPPPGQALTETEVRDMVRFLCTLTDGFDPRNPAAYRNGAQCR